MLFVWGIVCLCRQMPPKFVFPRVQVTIRQYWFSILLVEINKRTACVMLLILSGYSQLCHWKGDVIYDRKLQYLIKNSFLDGYPRSSFYSRNKRGHKIVWSWCHPHLLLFSQERKSENVTVRYIIISSSRHQPIIWTNADLLSIESPGKKTVSEMNVLWIWRTFVTPAASELPFPFKFWHLNENRAIFNEKCNLKMSSGPLCLVLYMSTQSITLLLAPWYCYKNIWCTVSKAFEKSSKTQSLSHFTSVKWVKRCGILRM